MDNSTLRKLERHCNAAADIITNSVVTGAADTLADSTADPRDALAALVDAATLRRIAGDARAVRKAV